MEDKNFPVTQFIKLSNNEVQWRMLTNGLVRKLNLTATVERKPGVMVNVKLQITKIIPPEGQDHVSRVKVGSRTSMPEDVKNGLEKIETFFSNFYQKKMWFMFGFIEGRVEKTIMIIYYQDFDLAIYAIKPNEETIEHFMPEGMSLN